MCERASFILKSALLAFCLGTCVAHAADYYIDGKSGRDSNTGTEGNPFATIYRALDVVRPGDTIHVLPTTTYAGPFWISAQGLPGAPITIVGEGSGTAMAKVVGSNSFAIQVAESSSYVTIQGFDASSPGNYSAIFVSPGATHIAIIGNRAHDSGAAGIGTSGADYVTVSNNIVFNNAFNTSTACASGISLYQLRNTDGSTAIKNYVVNNVVYGNANKPGGPCDDSDGNGIVVDDAWNSQNNSPYGVYPGATLIANNVAFKNGGRGIHIYRSDNVFVTNNTLYYNNQDLNGGPWQPGEITLIRSGNDKIFNNIAYSDGLVNGYFHHVVISIQFCPGGYIVANNNLLYNATNDITDAYYVPADAAHENASTISVAPWGSWNIWADPQFKDPTAAGINADFQVLRGSRAAGMGNRAYTPVADILGNPAPQWPTVGAYELSVN